MATVNYDYSFTPNTAAKATEVNGNFNKIKQFAEGISTGVNLDPGSVSTNKIVDAAVDSTKIANNAVTTDKVANSAVTAVKIADGAVTASKLPANTFAVTFQQFEVATDLNNNPFGQEVTVTLTGGKNFTHVIGAVGWGYNSNANVDITTTGTWVGQQTAEQIKLWVKLGNNVASNNVIIKIWLAA